MLVSGRSNDPSSTSTPYGAAAASSPDRCPWSRSGSGCGQRAAFPLMCSLPDLPGISAVDPGLAVGKGTIVHRIDCQALFHHDNRSSPPFNRLARDRGITTLVLTGISTSGVVLSTVIEAADRDYQLCVLADGTEDFDAETRDVLLGKVFPRRASVIGTSELRPLLEKGLS